MHSALDGVKAHLITDGYLEAELAIIETLVGVPIARLKNVDTADVKTRDYPFMEILPESTSPSYRTDEGPMDFEAWDLHSIWLQVAQIGSDQKAVTYELLYYRDAIKRVVHDDNTFGRRFNRVRLGQAQFWPAVQMQERGTLLQIMRQNLQVRVLQH